MLTPHFTPAEPGSTLRGRLAAALAAALPIAALAAPTPVHSPYCSAGPNIVSTCNPVPITEATAFDGDGDPLSFRWFAEPGCGLVTFLPSARVLNPAVFVEQSCDATCTVVLTVSDGTGTDGCESKVRITLRDRPPVLSPGPLDLTVECDAIPAPAVVTATDDCQGTLPVTFRERDFTGGGEAGCADGEREGYLDLATHPDIAGCSGGWSIPGILSATMEPSCGAASGDDSPNPNGAGCNVADLCAPGWHVALSAAEVAANSPTGAAGAGAPGSTDFFATRQSGTGCGECATGSTRGGACNDPDSCATDCLQFDLLANDLFGVGTIGVTPGPSCGPLDRSSGDECFDLPPPWSCARPGNIEAMIVTKGGPLSGGVVCVRDMPVEPGGCPDERVIRRTWTTRDSCGNVASHAQVIRTRDTTPPALAPPADAFVECGSATGPAATGLATALDNCDPAPELLWRDEIVPGHCPADYTIRRTWVAIDRCGNSTSALQSIVVADTQPPYLVSAADARECLWPPSHWWTCFDAGRFAPELADACSEPVTWRLSGCLSSQPANELGDGNTDLDCTVAPDGTQVCVRAERQGTRREDRVHVVAAVAVDACGNASEPFAVGEIRVPHDRREQPDCQRTTETGRQPRQGLPW